MLLYQASSADGTIIAVLDTDEWKYTSQVLYGAIYGYCLPTAVPTQAEANNDSTSKEELSVSISAWSRAETSSMSQSDIRLYSVKHYLK